MAWHRRGYSVTAHVRVSTTLVGLRGGLTEAGVTVQGSAGSQPTAVT